jgi:SPX domain protein involved in polyphosphate accumulation
MSRFEKKFILNPIYISQFRADLFRQGYRKIFKDRTVNSVYFDDKNLNSYYENINGLSKRTKFRLRFYSEIFEGEGFWEQKIKHADTNHKKVQKYRGEVVPLIQLQFPRKEQLMPLVHVQYSREYYYSEKTAIRVTIDSSIKFINLKNSISYPHNELVVEYKSSVNNPVKNVPKILSNLSRSSKYCKAISVHGFASELY